MKKNYQLELDAVLLDIKSNAATPLLLLHACCGPCSSYVLEYLSEYFNIIIQYYNPGIFPFSEHERRLNELCALLERLPHTNNISLQKCDYDHEHFLQLTQGHEDDAEGGVRCFLCYEDRLRYAAISAQKYNCDYFATTLSISPHKNAEKLNEIACALELEYNVKHLPADFKKRGGFKRSLELSAQYNMYRQDYCGCEFSIQKSSQP